MLRTMEEGTIEAASAVGSVADSAPFYSLKLDTAIMDEAACVLETAIPVVLALGIQNLLLVGVSTQPILWIEFFVSLAELQKPVRPPAAGKAPCK